MSPDLFESILAHQETEGLLKTGESIQLYAYGEPFLHPALDEILRILKRRGNRANLSSNFIRQPKVPESLFPVIDYVVFSLCGLTDETYRPIYGADIRAVLQNFDRFLADRERHGPGTDVVVNWLEYRFNAGQSDAARAYFASRRCTFRSILAFINDVSGMIPLLENRLDPARFPEMSQDIDVARVAGSAGVLKERHPDYRCPQYGSIFIDEKGRLMGCCVIDKGQPAVAMGNILEMGRDEIFRRKSLFPPCKACVGLGIAQLIHEGLFDGQGAG